MADAVATLEPATAKQEKPPGYLLPCWGAITMSQAAGRPTSVLGEPITYAWQDAIYPGEFINASTGVSLSVTPERQLQWANKIKAMNRAGIDIPIICGFGDNPHVGGPHANYGKVVDARIKDNRLQVEMALIGDEARKLAARNKVSILVPRNSFTDGKGREWSDFIAHLCITDKPVIPGLGLPFAASVFGQDQQFIALSFQGASLMGNDMMPSAVSDGGSVNGGAMSGMTNLPVSGACMSELHQNVPGLQEQPMENKAQHISNHIKKMSGMANNIGAKAPMDDGMSFAVTKETMDAAMSFSRRIAAARTPEFRDAQIDAVNAARDRAIAAGNMPAVVNKLYAELVGDPAKGVYNDIALSRIGGLSADGKCLALSIFTALEENKPIALSQQTGQQSDVKPLAGSKPGMNADLVKTVLSFAPGASSVADPIM